MLMQTNIVQFVDILKELHTAETTLPEKSLPFPLTTSLQRKFDIRPTSPQKSKKKSFTAHFKTVPLSFYTAPSLLKRPRSLFVMIS